MARTWRVGPGGDFATISQASAVVQAGDTVHVAAGIYRESVVTTADGTAAAPITFIADPGAVIMPAATGDTGWWVKGDYTTLDGFEVDGGNGQTWQVGVYLTGSYDTVTNATVHNIALGPVNDANGAAGILADSYYGGTHATISDSTVYAVGKDRLDQGIYISNPDSSVTGNTVYDIASVGIHLWHNATGALIENNTVYDSGAGILVGGGGYYNGFTGPDDYTRVIDNTVYNSDYGIAEQGYTGTHNVYDGNLLYGIVNEEYRLQNGNTWTPGSGANPPAPATDWDDVTLPQLLDHFEDHLERWLEKHAGGPGNGTPHFVAHIDLYWS